MSVAYRRHVLSNMADLDGRNRNPATPDDGSNLCRSPLSYSVFDSKPQDFCYAGLASRSDHCRVAPESPNKVLQSLRQG